MKEKGLKLWLQQVGRGEAWNRFCWPRSLAEHRPARCCLSCPLSIPPTEHTWHWGAEHGLCFALPIHQGRGSAAGSPRGRDWMTWARVGATAAATGQGLPQRERERQKPMLCWLCCSRQNSPSDSRMVALGSRHPVSLSPSWLTWTIAYHEKLGMFSEPLYHVFCCCGWSFWS